MTMTEQIQNSPLALAVADLEQREAAAREAIAAAESRAADAEAQAESARSACADATANGDARRTLSQLRAGIAALLAGVSPEVDATPCVPTRESFAGEGSLAFLDAPAADKIELLTHSRRKVFNACRYKHHVAYTLGIRPTKTSEALAFGTFCHLCIEAYWRARANGDDAPFDAIVRVADENRALIDAFAFVKAVALLARYAMSWGQVVCTVLAIEAEFTAPLLDETGGASRCWRLGGKVDLIIRLDVDALGLPAGAVVLVEHKTTGATLDVFRESLVVAGQAGQYTIGARAIGIEIDHVIYDVLVKPKLSPYEATPEADRQYTKPTSERKCKPCKGAGSTQVDGVHVECKPCKGAGSFPGEPARLYAKHRERNETAEEYGARIEAAIDESPGDYIAQIEAPRTADEMARFERDVWDAHQLIQLSKERRIIDRNESECIGRYGTKCEYFDHCTGVTSLDDPTKFVRAGAHPELTNTAKEAT